MTGDPWMTPWPAGEIRSLALDEIGDAYDEKM
jgi:hypothetical protein